MSVSDTEMETRFTYHAPKGDQQERYVAIRAKARELAELINEATPDSREQALRVHQPRASGVLGQRRDRAQGVAA